MENKSNSIKLETNWFKETLHCNCGHTETFDRKKHKLRHESIFKIFPSYECPKCESVFDQLYIEKSNAKQSKLQLKFIFAGLLAVLITLMSIFWLPNAIKEYDLFSKWVKDKSAVDSKLKESNTE